MKIICDNCGSEVNEEPLKKTFDDIEITFIECKECCKEYTILVTDSNLRRMIKIASDKEIELRKMALNQKEKIDSLKEEYGNRIKNAKRMKNKISIEKEYKMEVNKLAKNYTEDYEREQRKYENMKANNIKYENELKKMYE